MKKWMLKTGLLASTTLLAAAPLAAQEQACNRDCLIDRAESYMAGLLEQNYAALPWSEAVYFTENQVSMMIGDALWGSISAKSDSPYIVTDADSGNIGWFGWVEEHGAPAYYGMRLKVENGMISEVESVTARKEEPGVFAEDVDSFNPAANFAEEIPEAERSPRQRMIDIAAGHYSTQQLNDGTLFTQYAADCEWRENGQVLAGQGDEAEARDCQSLMELGIYQPVDRVRDRRFPLVNEAQGTVVAFSTRDIGNESETFMTTDGRVRQLDETIYYPHSHGTVDIFKIRNGVISRIETLSNFLPYYMPSPWMERIKYGTQETGGDR